MVDLVPEQCDSCRRRLSGVDAEPLRHQVTEIPPLHPVVTEYRCHTLRCPHCGTSSRAELPAGVSAGAFGERLSAMVCLLVSKYRLSKRLVQSALSDMVGVHLALGSISNLEQEMSAVLAASVEEATDFVQAQQAVQMDETGWCEGN